MHLGIDDTDSRKGMCTTFTLLSVLREVDLVPPLVPEARAAEPGDTVQDKGGERGGTLGGARPARWQRQVDRDVEGASP
ncbi:hypothetical protein [Thermogymnomonas acidicola]|uniref:hypothetical protein n=1 Tax=Thermogymnomonas acidicola TaxID=399579 RepID=UPI0009467D6B|nr:hypothetical protein [Thermogymnomonas acidicola]